MQHGAEAGDHALAVLARGGVYLAGGIAPRILQRLPSDRFLAAFNDKREHAGHARVHCHHGSAGIYRRGRDGA